MCSWCTELWDLLMVLLYRNMFLVGMRPTVIMLVGLCSLLKLPLGSVSQYVL